MITLKEDFADDEVFYAGEPGDTDKLNGITSQVNSNTVTKLKYIGHDTEGSIASSTTETTIANVTIPAGSFSTGSIATASIFFTSNSAGSTGTFKLKMGAAGSETLKQTIILIAPAADSANQGRGGCLLFYDTAENYANELSVIVTGQNSANNAAQVCWCKQLVVTGY